LPKQGTRHIHHRRRVEDVPLARTFTHAHYIWMTRQNLMATAETWRGSPPSNLSARGSRIARAPREWRRATPTFQT
jgi:hypothetical protein